MPTPPIIGITGWRDTSARLLNAPLCAVGETYVHAIAQAGGTPLIIPPRLDNGDDLENLLSRIDGLLLSGGEDIHPGFYGQESESWLGGTNTTRDRFELSLVKQWLPLERPLLGICRGHQIFNVALGGTLYQDIAGYIPQALDHAYSQARPMEKPAHSVTLSPHSQLANILMETLFEVNSAHHQAVKKVAASLAVTATASDGIIEALELPGHPFAISVQWHPEAMLQIGQAMAPLFQAFVIAAQTS